MLGEFTDYDGLLRVLRLRANEQHVARSDDQNADLAGIPNKYLAKLLGPRPVRRLGSKSMGPVFGLLQIKCIVVVDDEAVKRYGHRVRKRDERLVRGGTVHVELSHRHMQKIRKRGGYNSRKYMSKSRARQLGRTAAFMRWDRIKAAARRLLALA